jgi:hypothetical protein
MSMGMRGIFLTVFRWVWVTGSISLFLIICFAAVVIPMPMGKKKISKDEIILGRYESICGYQK